MPALTPRVATLESSSPVGRSLGRSDRQSERQSERQSQQRSASISDQATHHNRRKSANGGLTIALAVTALALFHTALFMRSIPLPIVVTSSLNGTERDVGLMFSLCADLEIVVMGVFIWRPLKHGERAAIAAGFAAFVAYFVVIAMARSVGPVFWAQILRAIRIALVTYLGIGFFQSLLPHRAGAAAALFSNAGQVGSVAAALGVGALGQAFGYESIFVARALLSAAALVMICLAPSGPD